MSDEFWWVAARLHHEEPGRTKALAEGTLAEMIWLALELAPSEQQTATIEAASSGQVLHHPQWKALSEQSGFPTCI